MEKIISLATKMQKKRFNNKSIENIYSYFINDTFGKQISSGLGPKNVIELIFLIYLIDKGHEPISSLKFIKSNIFAFSTIDLENFSDDTCMYCGGEGTVNCDNCNGTGEEECPDCKGTGSVEYDIDSNEYETCSRCEGFGEIECDDCGGRGNFNCDNCDGIGEITSDTQINSIISEYVSIDRNIFNKIELLNKKDLFDINKILKSNLVLLISHIDKTVDIYDFSEQDIGETLFLKYTKSPDFYTYSNGKIYVGDLDYD